MKGKSNIGKIIISLPICIGLALFISSNILNTNYIKIYGLYGNNIAISDIEELSLKDTIPTINKRVNGIMLTNGKRKGYFNLDGKNARLYLYNDESPFIYIKTPKDQYYINLITADETKTFYNEIMKEKS